MRSSAPEPRYFSLTPTAPTEIYTLSLHDALPIYEGPTVKLLIAEDDDDRRALLALAGLSPPIQFPVRSEEHTSELQSRRDLVCRLLLEKKNRPRRRRRDRRARGRRRSAPRPLPTD